MQINERGTGNQIPPSNVDTTHSGFELLTIPIGKDMELWQLSEAIGEHVAEIFDKTGTTRYWINIEQDKITLAVLKHGLNRSFLIKPQGYMPTKKISKMVNSTKGYHL